MYHYHVLDYISFLDKDNTEPENSTEKELLHYLKHLQDKKLSTPTKRLHLHAIKQYYNWQIETDQRIDNPAKRIKLRQQTQQKTYLTLTVQELQNLYHNYPVPKEEDKNNHKNWFTAYKLSRERNKIIIGLLINQALTTTEITRIQLQDIDLRQATIQIRGGRKLTDRTLPLKSHQIIDLMEYQYKTRTLLLNYHKEPTQRLFLSVPSLGKTQVENSNTLDICRALNQELRQQNPKLSNLQQIRTSVIIHWLKQYNLRQVQYKAGHKQIHTTEAYLINDVEDLQNEIDKYHPL